MMSQIFVWAAPITLQPPAMTSTEVHLMASQQGEASVEEVSSQAACCLESLDRMSCIKCMTA